MYGDPSRKIMSIVYDNLFVVASTNHRKPGPLDDNEKANPVLSSGIPTKLIVCIDPEFYLNFELNYAIAVTRHLVDTLLVKICQSSSH